MKKVDLVKEVKKEHKYLNHTVIEGVLNTVFRAISKSLGKREKVTVYKFGEFFLKRSKVTHVYDFQEKRLVPYDGKYNIKFRACPEVQQEANRPRAAA